MRTAMTKTGDLDLRKARIVAALHPTRVRRGMKTDDQARALAVRLGISLRTLYGWENGDHLPADGQVPMIEAWLAEGPIWRYAGINRIVGPECDSSFSGESQRAEPSTATRIAV